MDDRELYIRLEGINVPVAVKQRVPAPNTERGSQTIDRLAHRVTARSKHTVVTRCADTNSTPPISKDLQLPQPAADDRAPCRASQFRVPYSAEVVTHTVVSTITTADHFERRPSRDRSRSPSHTTLPRKRRTVR